MDQAGPQMESIDIADSHLSGSERTTTIALHVGQTYVEYEKCKVMVVVLSHPLTRLSTILMLSIYGPTWSITTLPDNERG